ncbi:MAG: hypothetical protein ACYTHM_10725 [Planctomycetota bacterium]|jgi:hypothetical protein
MRTFRILWLALFAALGCHTYRAHYFLGLQSVEVSSGNGKWEKKEEIALVSKRTTAMFQFEDDIATFLWTPGSTYFDLFVNNKTSKTGMRVTDVIYVDIFGECLPMVSLYHSPKGGADASGGENYGARPIVKGEWLYVWLAPANRKRYKGGRIVPTAPLPLTDKDQAALAARAGKCVGKSPKIHLVLQGEGTYREYLFSFKVQDFSVVRTGEMPRLAPPRSSVEPRKKKESSPKAPPPAPKEEKEEKEKPDEWGGWEKEKEGDKDKD